MAHVIPSLASNVGAQYALLAKVYAAMLGGALVAMSFAHYFLNHPTVQWFTVTMIMSSPVMSQAKAICWITATSLQKTRIRWICYLADVFILASVATIAWLCYGLPEPNRYYGIPIAAAVFAGIPYLLIGAIERRSLRSSKPSPMVQ